MNEIFMQSASFVYIIYSPNYFLQIRVQFFSYTIIVFSAADNRERDDDGRREGEPRAFCWWEQWSAGAVDSGLSQGDDSSVQVAQLRHQGQAGQGGDTRRP